MITERDISQPQGEKSATKSLENVRNKISSKYFKSNYKKAVLYIFIGTTFYFISILLLLYLYTINYYWFYPLGYFIAGTAVTSLFVLGHDCGHQSLLKNNKVNDLLGHIFFLAPIYPFYAWKYSHNAHHKHTNQLYTNQKNIYYDNAWIPLTTEVYLELKTISPISAFIYKICRYFPPIGSFFHNIITHYFIKKFNEVQRKKVISSYIFLIASNLLIFILLLKYLGIFAFFHFYILPAVFFQFWMSIYTYQHHTSETIQFYEKDEWTPYKAQIQSTYNSFFPRIISFLHFNIDVHTPHHLSTAIPSYYLRDAYEELKASPYGLDLLEAKFSIQYYIQQIMNCHLWDRKERRYKRFSNVERVD